MSKLQFDDCLATAKRGGPHDDEQVALIWASEQITLLTSQLRAKDEIIADLNLRIVKAMDLLEQMKQGDTDNV